MLDCKYITTAFNLQNFFTVNAKIEKNILYIHLNSKPSIHICPHCGKETKRVHDYRTQNVKFVRICGYNSVLVLKKRRYLCSCCGKKFYENYPFVAKHHSISNSVFLQIINDLKSVNSLKDIAKANGVSTNTVARALKIVAIAQKNELPEVLSIDEFKGNAGGEKYLVQISDAKNKKLLNILPSRKFTYLSEFFSQYSREERKKVKYLVIDMYQNYRRLVVYFPNAKIVVDKFHFVRQTTWALDNVRKKIQKEKSKEGRLRFKRLRSLLHKRYENLNAEDRLALETMLGQSEELRDAWRLKEGLYEIISSKTNAREKLTKWIELAKASGISEFKGCINAYKNWIDGIVESIETGYSNGFTEGKNNKIKVMKRNAFGFRSFENFKKRILICS